MTGGDNCDAFESTDDREVAAWWPDSAGERLIMEPFRRGGEAGGEAVKLPPELDTDATSADARPVVLRLGEGADTMVEGLEPVVVVVELRRHRRRLRPLAVEVMLTESESRTRSGERYCASGKGVTIELLAGTVNARVLGVGAPAEVGDVWNSPVPIMDSLGAGGTMVRPGPPLLLGPGGWAWESATWCDCMSGLTVAVDAALGGGAGRGGAGGSAWFVREREREEERETTLRTRSRRLPVEEEGVRGRVLFLPCALRVFMYTGVGVGIPLSVSGSDEWSGVTNEGGRL
jgi:hypothetical protein